MKYLISQIFNIKSYFKFFLLIGFSLTGCASFKTFFEVSNYERIEIPTFTFQTKWIQSLNSLDTYETVVGASYLALSENKELLLANNARNQLVAFRPQTGEKIWSFPINSGVEGKPIIDKKTIFVGGRDGVFYALNLKGEKKWSYPTLNLSVSSPAVTKTRVYFHTSSGDVLSLSKKTGKKIWKKKQTLSRAISIKGLSRPLFHKGKLIIGFQDGTLKAFRATNGALLWSKKLSPLRPESQFLDVDAEAYALGGKIFISNFDGYLYCMNLYTGKVLWKKPYGSSFPVVFDKKRKRLYHSTSKQEVVALSVGSGKKIWSYKTQGLATGGVLQNNYLWIGEFQGAVKALDLDGGNLVSRFFPGEGVSSPLVFLDSRNFVFLSKRANLFNLTF